MPPSSLGEVLVGPHTVGIGTEANAERGSVPAAHDGLRAVIFDGTLRAAIDVVVDDPDLAIENRFRGYRPAFSNEQPQGVDHDPLASFNGCFDSGDPDWASPRTHALRGDADPRRPV